MTKVLTEAIEGLTGGRVLVEPDPERAADLNEAHIAVKRQALGLERTVEEKRWKAA